MKRGDIYYIEINDEGVTGHEMMKSRPGIIVSRDDHNEAAETVQVVYCSASSTGSCRSTSASAAHPGRARPCASTSTRWTSPDWATSWDT